jgi:hypothetical protein
MPLPLVVTLPPNVHLSGGCIVRVAALDPTTGAIVTGVNVSDVSLEVDEISGGAPADLELGAWLLVPGPGA